MLNMGERVGTSIGIIGGTGALGGALAFRFATAGYEVRLGSRSTERAQEVARHLGHTVSGGSNADASACDLVVIAVPWSAHRGIVQQLAPHLADRIVVDAVNPLGFDDRGPFAIPVDEGSAAEQAQQLLPSSVVLGAFHHLSAETLRNADALDADVLVVGDDRDAIGRLIAVIDSVAGLRGVYAGRLRNAQQVEALTANLIAINRRYRTQAGVRITGDITSQRVTDA